MRLFPSFMGGSGIPRVTETAPASLVASVKAIAPLLRKHRPDLYRHLLATTSGDDPLGVNRAYGVCKRAHDWHTRNGHDPPTCLPATVNEAITAKRRLDDFALSRNTHSRNKLMLIAEMQSFSSLPRSAATLLCARSAKYAGAWLSLPPPCIHIATPAVAQPDHLWFAAYKVWVGLDTPQARTGHTCVHRCPKSGNKIEIPMDVDHLLTCSKGHHRTKRHDDIRDRVAVATSEAGYPTKT